MTRPRAACLLLALCLGLAFVGTAHADASSAAAPAPGPGDGNCGSIGDVPAHLKCEYARTCDQDDGLLPYYRMYYCSTKPYGTFLTCVFVLFLAVLAFALFIVLGSTAEDYLSPILTTLCQDMKLPARFAGVTFLALGNGAPDVSATVAAVRSGDYNLSLGALTGAGMFVNCIVAGCVVLQQDHTKFKGAMIRDVTAYAITILTMLVALHSGAVSFATVGIFISFYVIYVVVVFCADMFHIFVVKPRESLAVDTEAPLLGDGVGAGAEEDDDHRSVEMSDRSDADLDVGEEPAEYRRHALAELAASKSFLNGPRIPHRVVLPEDDDEGEGGDDVLASAAAAPGASGPGGEAGEEGGGESAAALSPMSDLTSASAASRPRRLSLRDRAAMECAAAWEEFKEGSAFEKFSTALELPFTAVRLASVPRLGREMYCQPQVVAGILGMPTFMVFYLGAATPVSVLLAVAVGCALSVLATATTQDLTPPAWRLGTPWPIGGAAANAAAFAVAALWVDVIASELVGVLAFLGVWTGVDSGVLGLTVLAWGNSIGDYMTNLKMAKSGFGNAAMTACFAGPVFNMLVGLGVGFDWLLVAAGEGSVPVHLDENILIGGMFLLINCVVLVAVGLTHGQRLPRWVGYFLLAWYALYMLAMVLNLMNYI